MIEVVYTTLSVCVIALSICLSHLFTGWLGVLIFVVASLLVLVPVRLGVPHVHLMSVLIGPIVLTSW